MTMTVAIAQQIAVVSEGGETSVYRSLEAAINGAEPGSVIYLPGGSFPVSDNVKITKRLTIIGIGHKYYNDNDNANGNTIIAGNLFFNEGSSSSSIMGCYITGDVNIGKDNSAVSNVLVKCCNTNSIDSNGNCEYTTVNQNYIRSFVYLRGCNCSLSNNILHWIHYANSSTICNNIIIGGDYYISLVYVYNSNFYNNVFLNFTINTNYSGGNLANNNMFINNEWGDNSVNLTDCTWDDVFVNYNEGSITPASNFHFKEAYKQYESQVGVYAGGVDFDKQMAPVPYIVAKRIAEETDAAGQLKIQVRVKAGD